MHRIQRLVTAVSPGLGAVVSVSDAGVDLDRLIRQLIGRQIHGSHTLVVHQNIVEIDEPVQIGGLVKLVAAVGILVADILPQTLYDQKLSLYSFGSESYTFLQCDGLLCDNSQFAAYASSVTTNGLTQDKRYYCAVSSSEEGWSVITFVPQKVFRQRLAAILGVFVAVDVILISLGMLFASNVADSVIKPLNNVSKKMGKI